MMALQPSPRDQNLKTELNKTEMNAINRYLLKIGLVAVPAMIAVAVAFNQLLISKEVNESVKETSSSFREAFGAAFKSVVDSENFRMRSEWEDFFNRRLVGFSREQLPAIIDDKIRISQADQMSEQLGQRLLQDDRFLEQLRRIIIQNTSAGSQGITIRNIAQSQQIRRAGGPPRQNPNPEFDEISIRGEQGDPQFTLPANQRGIIVVNASAGTGFDTRNAQGIGFQLEIIINGEVCAVSNDHAALMGNAPRISLSCTYVLEGGVPNSLVIRRGVFGSGFINNSENTFMTARYSLITYDK